MELAARATLLSSKWTRRRADPGQSHIVLTFDFWFNWQLDGSIPGVRMRTAPPYLEILF
jgi:hypothetical protein